MLTTLLCVNCMYYLDLTTKQNKTLTKQCVPTSIDPNRTILSITNRTKGSCDFNRFISICDRNYSRYLIRLKAGAVENGTVTKVVTWVNYLHYGLCIFKSIFSYILLLLYTGYSKQFYTKWDWKQRKSDVKTYKIKST